MPPTGAPVPDPRKVRVGLAIVTAVVVIAIALAFLVDAPAGKALMIGIAVLGFVRVFLLFRSLRS